MSTARINEFTQLLPKRIINTENNSDIDANPTETVIDIIYDTQDVKEAYYEKNGKYYKQMPFQPRNETLEKLEQLEQLRDKYTKRKRMIIACPFGIATIPGIILASSFGIAEYLVYRYAPHQKQLLNNQIKSKWAQSSYATGPFGSSTLTCDKLFPVDFKISIENGECGYEVLQKYNYPDECRITTSSRAIEGVQAIYTSPLPTNNSLTCRDLYPNITGDNYCHIESFLTPREAAESYCINEIYFHQDKCDMDIPLARLHTINDFPTEFHNASCADFLSFETNEDCDQSVISYIQNTNYLYCSAYMPDACNEQIKNDYNYKRFNTVPVLALDNHTCSEVFLAPNFITDCEDKQNDLSYTIRIPDHDTACDFDSYVFLIILLPLLGSLSIFLLSFINSKWSEQATLNTRVKHLSTDDRKELNQIFDRDTLSSETPIITLASTINEKYKEIDKNSLERQSRFTFILGFSDPKSSLSQYRDTFPKELKHKILFFADLKDEPPVEHSSNRQLKTKSPSNHFDFA